MAEAAAQAAALKAFQDAIQQSERGNGYNAGACDMSENNFWMYGSSEINQAQRYIEADEQRLIDCFQQGKLDVEMFHANDNPPDDATAYQLLRLLEQQQQQEQMQQLELQQRQSFRSRPEKHYLTIAQNGKPLPWHILFFAGFSDSHCVS
jgi:hypothetical protein